MAKECPIVHHADRRTDVVMPYAPGIVVRRGCLVFLSGVTAAPVYHHHPHREEDFDLPPTMREQARAHAGEPRGRRWRPRLHHGRPRVGHPLPDGRDGAGRPQSRLGTSHLGGHLPTTTTVEVSRLATHPRCKLEISAIAVTDGD